MEEPTPDLKGSSEARVDQSSNKRLHDIQQEYLEQWHLLENLGSSMDAASEVQPPEEDNSPSSQNSATRDIHEQDNHSNDDLQEKGGSKGWFVLREESAEGIGTRIALDDYEMIQPGISTDMMPKGQNISQLSPYAEQWYELEQLKASVRSLSHAAGLPHSPQQPAAEDETLASGLSSGSLSVEALDEVGLLDAQVIPQEGTVQEGVVTMGLASEAVDVMEQVDEDDPADSGASLSVDDSGIEDKQLGNQWFPLRPSAVGEDDEDAVQVSYGTAPASHSPNNDRLQNVPHAWSDDDGKQSPPERSQPDGRDGPDLKRTPWISNTYGSAQQAVSAPVQNQQLAGGTPVSKDSGSDVSVNSQPHNDHNITPLEIITRSVPPVPPAKKGVSLMSELRQKHAPQLNSDSDTESPVSKLLGPNFRAVQQVLDKLKQDRLTDSVSDEADEVASGGLSTTEGYVKSIPSAAMPTSSTGSRAYGVEWTTVRPITERKSSSETDAVVFPKAFSSRSPPSSHKKEYTAFRHSLDESHRRFSESDISIARRAVDARSESSWTSAKVPLRPSEITHIDTTPQTTMQADLTRLSSTNVLKRLPPGERLADAGPTLPLPAAKKSSKMRDYPQAPTMVGSDDLLRRDLLGAISVPTVPPPPLPIPEPYLSEQSSRSSMERNLKSSRIAWDGDLPPATKESVQRAAYQALSRSSIESSVPAIGADSGLSLSSSINRVETKESLTINQADNPGFERQPNSTFIDGTEIVPRDGSKDRMRPDQSKALQSGSPAADWDRKASSDDSDGTKSAPDFRGDAFQTAKEESEDSIRTAQNQGRSLQSGGGLEHLRDSDRSASSDDTDDLLNYEPVLEGDRQYLRMQKREKLSGLNEHQSKAAEGREKGMFVGSSTGLPTGENAATRMSGREQPSSTLRGQYETPSEIDDSRIKSLHWSLGAGTISPISVTTLAQRDSRQQEKSSTPLGSASEQSGPLEHGILQEQSLEDQETLVHPAKSHHVVKFKKTTQGRSSTDVSSSDDIYKPPLYRDVSENKENRPNESVFATSSYGIYDIRRSSGPGSTNRRRKALGLEPNPAREATSQNGPGMVYISGSSTPTSVPDGASRPSGEIEGLAGKSIAHRNVQLEKDHYEESFESNEELMRPRAREQRDSSVLNSRQAQVFRNRYQHGHMLLEERHKARAVKARDSSESHRTAEKRITSERPNHLLRQYMDESERNHTSRSVSSGKSRRRHTGDSLGTSSQPSTLEKKARTSRRPSDGKTRHRSRGRTDSNARKTTRLDDNISKLSSLVSKSIDESISSSSHTSVIPSSRWSSSKSSKHRMTSSSESSDVSEFFNYAFMEPRLRSSMKHKIRIRELLKSVKAQDISPIIRMRGSTSTESTTNVSSYEGRQRERNGEGENEREEREPSAAVTQPRRPEAFAVPFSDPIPAEVEPKCTCGVSQTGVVQTTFPAKSRKVEGKDVGKEFSLPRKRDIGVNCPTPVIIRSPAAGSDESLHAQDAGTQTEEVVAPRKANGKTELEPVKSRRKTVKGQLRSMEERGVISQPSPKRSDYIYSVDHREAQYKAKERLIPSQNSPDHSVKTTSDRTSRAQIPAWFHPLTSKPQAEQRALSDLKTPSKSRTNDELRVDVFDAAVNSSSSLQKLSLQEAFLYAKSSFVKRSQERVARIEQAAREKERRKLMEDAAAEERRKEASKTTTPSDTPTIKTRVKGSDQLHVPKPRQMTRAEMKALNQRLYKNLPEVKAKHEQMKRQAFYRTNRLRAQLYDKRVRTRLKGAGN